MRSIITRNLYDDLYDQLEQRLKYYISKKDFDSIVKLLKENIHRLYKDIRDLEKDGVYIEDSKRPEVLINMSNISPYIHIA